MKKLISNSKIKTRFETDLDFIMNKSHMTFGNRRTDGYWDMMYLRCTLGEAAAKNYLIFTFFKIVKKHISNSKIKTRIKTDLDYIMNKPHMKFGNPRTDGYRDMMYLRCTPKRSWEEGGGEEEGEGDTRSGPPNGHFQSSIKWKLFRILTSG